MRSRHNYRAFSLAEVLVATGIFAFALVATLAVLPVAARQAADSDDLQTAARLGDAVRLQARQLVPASSFAAFRSLQLVAGRDGSNLRPLPAADGGEEYFLIDLSPYARDPLLFAADTPLLALTARIGWPYQASSSGNTAAVAAGHSEHFSFAFTLRP